MNEKKAKKEALEIFDVLMIPVNSEITGYVQGDVGYFGVYIEIEIDIQDIRDIKRLLERKFDVLGLKISSDNNKILIRFKITEKENVQTEIWDN